ncbi:hypothetical protein IWX63_003064 [Arthrobacter sp. CAN_A2]|uniref:YrhK family protein n=1 Tax=Arthrobacter sp. CAN_A2 TaxID=2787718 RepID=UPI001A1F5A5C
MRVALDGWTPRSAATAPRVYGTGVAIMISAVWFIIDSILSFNEETTTTGTLFFLAGTLELLIRPVIRLTRKTRIRTVSANSNTNDF